MFPSREKGYSVQRSRASFARAADGWAPRLRTFSAVILAAAATALGVAPGALPLSAAAATRPSTQTPAHVNLADPGFSDFGGTFYIYGTGERFPVATATRWNGPYGRGGTVLAAQPGWLGTCPTFGHSEWAPQVFRADGKYVLYYTACDGDVSPLAHCVGIATSASPASGFIPVGRPICAPASQGAGTEAIDPSPYQVAGHRYLLFKTSHGNRSAWTIWAIAMTAAGTATAGAPRALIRPSSIMEAPFALNHGGKVWLFVARNWFNSCAYSTDVYKAGTIKGPFTRVGSLLSRASTGLCGPGGASLTWSAGTYYIAYHAWANGSPTSGTRVTYVAQIGWRANGNPYVK